VTTRERSDDDRLHAYGSVRLSGRARVRAYGGAGALVVAGALCGVLISGLVGTLLAMMLVGSGLVVAVSLVFYEVGLSEDRIRTKSAPPGGNGAVSGSTTPSGQAPNRRPRTRPRWSGPRRRGPHG
jgi:hypothetical protein